MTDQATIKRLDKASMETRLNLLKLCQQTVIHIGGDMSCCDIMTVIWQYAIHYDPANPQWEERDRFVLSKGHAAAVTSFSQAAIGCYHTEDIYKEYATDFGRFGMHSCNLRNPYVDVSTGSLGHGLPIAGGIATALKAKNSQSRVFTVVGDGECGEGSIWEAAMAAVKHKLGNLIVFVDRNFLSFDGSTEEYMPLNDMAARWRAFNWNVIEVKDGNDMQQLVEAVDSLPKPDSEVPTVVVCNTVKGHGISFMENNSKWHAGMIDSDNYQAAVAEIKDAYHKKWGED
ncbi:MAG: transketolase [Lachnospiraceae bacterium]|nr:transketolase [Lachnospiraceae bacterium]